MTVNLRPVLLSKYLLSHLKHPPILCPIPLQSNTPWNNSPHSTLFAEAREAAISSHSQFHQESGLSLLLWLVRALSKCPHYTVTADITRDYWVKKMDVRVHKSKGPQSPMYFPVLSTRGRSPPSSQLGLPSRGHAAGPYWNVLKYKITSQILKI